MSFRRGELVAALSGLGLLAVSLLTWYHAGSDVSMNAWQAYSVTDFIIGLAGFGALYFAVTALARPSLGLPVAGSAITADLGVLAGAVIAYRLIDPPAGAQAQVGAWLGLAASAAIFLGGYIGMQETEA